MEELEQKHLHLLQVVESEKTAKWQYTQHCEELTEEIKKLRTEVSGLKVLKTTFYLHVKGHLISKGLFKVFICTKKQTKIFFSFLP